MTHQTPSPAYPSHVAFPSSHPFPESRPPTWVSCPGSTVVAHPVLQAASLGITLLSTPLLFPGNWQLTPHISATSVQTHVSQPHPVSTAPHLDQCHNLRDRPQAGQFPQPEHSLSFTSLSVRFSLEHSLRAPCQPQDKQPSLGPRAFLRRDPCLPSGLPLHAPIIMSHSGPCSHSHSSPQSPGNAAQTTLPPRLSPPIIQLRHTYSEFLFQYYFLQEPLLKPRSSLSPPYGAYTQSANKLESTSVPWGRDTQPPGSNLGFSVSSPPST